MQCNQGSNDQGHISSLVSTDNLKRKDKTKAKRNRYS